MIDAISSGSFNSGNWDATALSLSNTFGAAPSYISATPPGDSMVAPSEADLHQDTADVGTFPPPPRLKSLATAMKNVVGSGNFVLNPMMQFQKNIASGSGSVTSIAKAAQAMDSWMQSAQVLSDAISQASEQQSDTMDNIFSDTVNEQQIKSIENFDLNKTPEA